MVLHTFNYGICEVDRVIANRIFSAFNCNIINKVYFIFKAQY